MTIGSYDGAELRELVGLYLLDLFTKEFGKKILAYIQVMVYILLKTYPDLTQRK